MKLAVLQEFIKSFECLEYLKEENQDKGENNQNSDQKLNKIYEDKHCGICLIDFQKGDQLRILCFDANSHAQHVFHEPCLNLWFKKKIICPMCRKSFQAKFDKMLNEKNKGNRV